MKADWQVAGILAVSAAALLRAAPFAWMAVPSLRPGVPADIAPIKVIGQTLVRHLLTALRGHEQPFE